MDLLLVFFYVILRLEEHVTNSKMSYRNWDDVTTSIYITPWAISSKMSIRKNLGSILDNVLITFISDRNIKNGRSQNLSVFRVEEKNLIQLVHDF